MYDARTKPPAQLVDTRSDEDEELEEGTETLPAVDLDPAATTGLVETAAHDGPAAEPEFGDPMLADELLGD